MAPLYEQLHGVLGVRAGYMGGWAVSPSQEQVDAGLTGHAEVVEVTFDTRQTKLRAVLKAFFSFHSTSISCASRRASRCISTNRLVQT